MKKLTLADLLSIEAYTAQRPVIRQAMMEHKKQLSISIYHGESCSLFYIVDSGAPDALQPCVVATFTTRTDALNYIEEH